MQNFCDDLLHLVYFNFQVRKFFWPSIINFAGGGWEFKCLLHISEGSRDIAKMKPDRQKIQGNDDILSTNYANIYFKLKDDTETVKVLEIAA